MPANKSDEIRTDLQAICETLPDIWSRSDMVSLAVGETHGPFAYTVYVALATNEWNEKSGPGVTNVTQNRFLSKTVGFTHG